jgi:NAD-dependent deacetylase sirtuin 5
LLALIHGSLFDSECCNDSCDYAEYNGLAEHLIDNFNIPHDISNAAVTMPQTLLSQLPHCPRCRALLRPGVVLFCEKYYQDTVNRVDSWFEEGPVDLILIVGTSLNVFPVAEYVDLAIAKGARVAVFNIEPPDNVENELRFGVDHWYFQGDAAQTLPELLKDVI